MPFKDMRELLLRLEAEGELLRVKKEVEGGYEIAAVMWELYNRFGTDAPAVIFETVKGHDIPVVKNIFGSLKRWALVSGMPNWREVTKIKEIRELFLDKVSRPDEWIDPVIVSDGPCKQKVTKGDDVNLKKLPIFKLHPADGGPYVTLPGVIMKDPQWGRNLGMYRVMVHDEKTTGLVANAAQDGGIFCARARQRGENVIDCAVALGFDPALYLAAVMKMPMIGRDAEFRFIGALTGKPVELVKCETIDMEVPASSEMVIEGRLHLDETRLEGPFGEYTGYYGEGMYQPVFKVSCITTRENPYYVSCTSAHLSSECLTLHYFQPLNWYNKMKREVVGFRDAFLPMEGRMYLAIIQIKKRYPGWGHQALMTALGSGWAMAIVNCVIVVDEDIDIYDWRQVLFAMATRVDPELDVIITKPAAVNAVNPAARARLPRSEESGVTDFNLCSKIGIDATKKMGSEANRSRPTPNLSTPDQKTLEKVRREWASYGLS